MSERLRSTKTLSLFAAFMMISASTALPVYGETSDWKSIYYNYLARSESDVLFALYDADEDGSPELLAYSTKYGASALSLYYGHISSAGNMEAADCYYKIPQTNEILAYREGTTFCKYTVYYLDGEFQIKTCFAVDTSGGQPAYFANGENITKEAYQKIAAPYDTSGLDTIPCTLLMK